MPIRYMGTKRYLALRVRDAVASVAPAGPVIDLFSGIGAVSLALAPSHSVITNDALAFTTVLARARFLHAERTNVAELIDILTKPFRAHERVLRTKYKALVAAETSALKDGQAPLAEYMEHVPHVGNNKDVAERAKVSASDYQRDRRYALTVLYFAGGYFSVSQAIQLDAIRYAIDTALTRVGDKDWALSAWLSAAAAVMNAPGHAAQYLKVTSEVSFKRVRRAWTMDVWQSFINRLADIKLEGNEPWRRRNRVMNEDALSLLNSDHGLDARAVYADPPYTKDHYSRYYHVYETMYLYDFPASKGAGRYRDDRFVTDFSVKTRVIGAFQDLADSVKRREVPLVLSYPSNGLLQIANGDLRALLEDQFSTVKVLSFDHEHSTMGASDGRHKKSAVENIYVCL